MSECSRIASEPFRLTPAPAPPVALVPQPQAERGPEREQVEAWCRVHGLALEVLRAGDDGDARGPWQLVVALGGDGTILRALRLAARAGAPVLGVNLGHVGFLADVQPGELGAALEAVAAGRARVERHAAIGVRVEGGPQGAGEAFNDVFVGRRGGQGAARIAVEADGTRVVALVGDGIIVASTLGSTAYNVSAGGPAVSPSIEAMVITPVAAQTGPLRSLVVAGDEQLRLVTDAASAPLTIEIDGRTWCQAPTGTTIALGRGSSRALLVRTTPDTFFEHLRDRLIAR